MTENLAGRGEGLAGRITELHREATVGEHIHTTESEGMDYCTICWTRGRARQKLLDLTPEILAALEAAAPAGTAPEQWKVELLSGKGNWSDAISPHFDTWEAAQGRANELAADSRLGVKFRVVRAALATPSPQAPACICGASSIFPKISCPVHGLQEPAGSGATREAAELKAATKEWAADILTACAQILDVVKPEWGESWSAWDQTIRNDITRWLESFYLQQAEKLPGSPRKVGEDGDIELAQEILKPHWPSVRNMEENEARQKEVERIAKILQRREEVRTRTPDWQERPSREALTHESPNSDFGEIFTDIRRKCVVKWRELANVNNKKGEAASWVAVAQLSCAKELEDELEALAPSRQGAAKRVEG